MGHMYSWNSLASAITTLLGSYKNRDSGPQNKLLLTTITYSVSQIVQQGHHYICAQEEPAKLKAAIVLQQSVCVAINIC